METGPRATQRPPRSCVRCTRSKIRCDKTLPCLQCRSRGLGEQCKVETVRINGRTITGSEGLVPEPSYAELVDENKKLLAQIMRDSGHLRDPPVAKPVRITGDNEERLYQRLRKECCSDRIWNISQVLFPSQETTNACLRHAATWTSWLHGAVNPEDFQQQVDNFYLASSATLFRSLVDPAQSAWLGVFFSYITVAALFMTHDELLQSRLPHVLSSETEDPLLVIRNWYNSALFFLHESQFLRILDIRNVQTIVILGVCFINFGDFNLYYNLWGCALRMAQALEISPGYESASVNDIDHQSHVQLWTALVTNDWLQIPLQGGHSGIDRVNAGSGFPECAFPFAEDCSAVQPLQYQFILAKLSLTLRLFYEHLVHSGGDYTVLASASLSADRDLSTIVSQLPDHLQPEAHLADGFQDREELHPWLFWQRENLCIILLYYRLVIYRPLCDIRNTDETGRNKAYLVCLDVAHGILASIQEFDSGDPIRHRRLIWSFLLPVFGAAATLLSLANHPCRCDTKTKHKLETRACLQWLDVAAERSHYAASAARCLRELSSELYP